MFTVPLHRDDVSGDSANSKEYLGNKWWYLGCPNNGRELLSFSGWKPKMLDTPNFFLFWYH